MKSMWKNLLGSMLVISLTACNPNESKASEGTGNNNNTEQNLQHTGIPIKIVCVGNSITEGFGNSCQEKAWPGQLNRLLGSQYNVLNCGVSGTTMFKNSDAPYWKTNRFEQALAAKPQILIIALGTNDADPWRWNKLKREFETDYLDMVAQFHKDGENPIIYVCLAPPLFGEVKKAQNDMVEKELIPAVKQIADKIGATIIDFHSPLLNASQGFPDNVHPDDKGAELMANIAFQTIKETQVIEPYLSINNGKTSKSSVAVVEKGSTVTFTPKPENGNWNWCSKGKIITSERELTLKDIQHGGIYTALHTSTDGKRSIYNFLVSVKEEKGPTITAHVKNMDDKWIDTDFIRVNPGGSIVLGPSAQDQDRLFWNWSGPDKFFAGTREVNFQTMRPIQTGIYTVTCTDLEGRQSSLNYTINVEGEIICPTLVSYINYGGWQQTNQMAVKEGDSVTFGPHPSNGEWHWTGPDGFESKRREATVNNFNAAKVGKYIGTFTNAVGCVVTLEITLTLKQ